MPGACALRCPIRRLVADRSDQAFERVLAPEDARRWPRRLGELRFDGVLWATTIARRRETLGGAVTACSRCNGPNADMFTPSGDLVCRFCFNREQNGQADARASASLHREAPARRARPGQLKLPAAFDELPSLRGLSNASVGFALALLSQPSDVVLVAEKAAWGVRIGLAILGTGLGSSAIGVAVARERTRRRFLARVVAGENPDYRIELTPSGQALIELPRGDCYRAASGCPVLLLDRSGAAVGLPPES